MSNLPPRVLETWAPASHLLHKKITEDAVSQFVAQSKVQRVLFRRFRKDYRGFRKPWQAALLLLGVNFPFPLVSSSLAAFRLLLLLVLELSILLLLLFLLEEWLLLVTLSPSLIHTHIEKPIKERLKLCNLITCVLCVYFAYA